MFNQLSCRLRLSTLLLLSLLLLLLLLILLFILYVIKILKVKLFGSHRWEININSLIIYILIVIFRVYFLKFVQ